MTSYSTLTWTDERAPSACAAPGVTPVDSSEPKMPVRELMWPSVLGESSVGCLQEPINGMKSLEYAIRATASVWMPFVHVHTVVFGEVDFNSFGMAPWDAGGIHDDRCQLHEAIQTMRLQWLMQLLCGPVMVHGLDRNMTMNTEKGLDMIIRITTDSPRLTVTPGECCASKWTRQTRCDLQHTHGVSAAMDGNTVELNYLTFPDWGCRRQMFPPDVMRAMVLRRYTARRSNRMTWLSADWSCRRLTFPPDVMRTVICPRQTERRWTEWPVFPPTEVAAGKRFRRTW